VDENTLVHVYQAHHGTAKALALLVHCTAAFAVKKTYSDDEGRHKGQENRDKVVSVVPEDVIATVSIKIRLLVSERLLIFALVYVMAVGVPPDH